MESFTVVKRITEDYTLLLKEDGSLSVFFGAMTGVEIEVGRKIFLFKPVSLDGNWLIYSKHCRAGTLSDEADNVLEEDISFMERKIKDHQDGCEDSARKRTFSSMRMSGLHLHNKGVGLQEFAVLPSRLHQGQRYRRQPRSDL